MAGQSHPAVRAWSTRLAVAVAVVVLGIVFTILAFGLPTWQRGQPGSGLFPQILGIGWLIFAVASLLLDILAERSERRAARASAASGTQPVPARRSEAVTVVLMMAASVAYVALFEVLGAIVASMLFGVAATLLLKDKPRTRTMIAVVATPVVLVVLIQVLLRQNLPAGVLQFIPFP